MTQSGCKRNHCYETIAITLYPCAPSDCLIGDAHVNKPLNFLTFVILTVSAAIGFAAAAAAGGQVLVTNGKDSGEGSLRAALEAVSKQEAPAQILVVTDGDIEIASTLTYTGKAPLAIYGKGQTVKTKADTTLLALTEGADLTVNGLDFEGPGGFDIKNRGKDGKGIFIDMRPDQTGVVTLVLEDVKVSGVAYHGVHISDCDLADDCGAGRGGKGGGSPASIVVRLSEVKISDVGNGRFDADGLRVDERSAGDILFYAQDSTFEKVGADGVELDEGQEGSVFATAVDSKFEDNGAYCDPKILKAFLPKEDEGEFDDGEKAETDIPGAVTGSPDDACIEREVELYESGSVKEYEFGIDTDDGFDIDEAGPGDLWALIVGATVTGNLDEGLDFGEEDEGGIKFAAWRTTAKDNTDDGIKIVESEGGSVEALLHKVTSKDNGGKGGVFEQRDAGDLTVVVDQSETGNNDDGDKTGLEVVQDGEGEGTLTVRTSEIADGIDAENVEIIEE
jgi:hypothetical protein